MQIKCDICDDLTDAPLVDYGEDGLPLILCQKCYARKRAIVQYKKQPNVKWQYVKPSTRVKENRYVTIYSVKRTNEIVYIVECFEDNVRQDTYVYKSQENAIKRRTAYLNHKGNICIRKKYKPHLDGIKNAAKRKKIRYVRAYNDTHYRQINLKLNIDKDKDLLYYFDTCVSKSQLVREMFEEWKKCKS